MEEINYIQSISFAKLAEYDQSRIDLPIRKYVLIANLLREENNKEQDWFEACLDDLQEDDDMEEIIATEDDIMSDQKTLPYEEEQDKLTHLFYQLPNGNALIVCTSPVAFS